MATTRSITLSFDLVVSPEAAAILVAMGWTPPSPERVLPEPSRVIEVADSSKPVSFVDVKPQGPGEDALRYMRDRDRKQLPPEDDDGVSAA